MLTQPLTEMSTRNLPGGRAWQVHKADSLIAICEPIVYKMWEPRRLTILRAPTPCYSDMFTITFCTRTVVSSCDLQKLRAARNDDRNCLCSIASRGGNNSNAQQNSDGQSKSSGTVALHCNGRTYRNANLITF
jgi:hypothetical protein